MRSISKFKVLIVDSHVEHLQKLSQFIESKIDPVIVYTAQNGYEALSKINNDKAHILISDFDLPKMSGIEMLRIALKEISLKHSSIIAFSEDDSNIDEFNNEIVNGRMQILQKPIDFEGFEKALIKAKNFAEGTTQAQMKNISLKEGEYLCRTGEVAEFAYYVKSGKLIAMTKNDDGHEVVVGEINQDEFVGELAHLTSSNRTADVISQTECELVEIPLQAIDSILFAKPSWARAMMKTLSHRLIQTNKKVKQS